MVCLPPHSKLPRRSRRLPAFRWRGARAVGLVLVLGAGLTWASAEGIRTEVDLLLVLAVDTSASISPRQRRLQRNGYVEAFRSSEITAAIRSGARGRIAVAYVEWAGKNTQHLTVPWTVIDGPEAANGFAERLAQSPLRRDFDTSLSGAIAFSMQLILASPFASERNLLDLSANGPNNTGAPVAAARDQAVAAGITINGLPVMTRIYWDGGLYSLEGLDAYFEDCVIGGPGAFILVVRHPEQFAAAIRRKLILEISGGPATLVPASFRTGQVRPRVDCLAGENNLGRLLPAQ
jgi:hypothetical protein